MNSKDGNVLHEIDMPRKMITSLTFGGTYMDILYVTTGAYDFPRKMIDERGGPIFALKGLSVKGVPANSFKLEK